MKSKKNQLKQMNLVCDRLYEEDGLDPKVYLDRRMKKKGVQLFEHYIGSLKIV